MTDYTSRGKPGIHSTSVVLLDLMSNKNMTFFDAVNALAEKANVHPAEYLIGIPADDMKRMVVLDRVIDRSEAKARKRAANVTEAHYPEMAKVYYKAKQEGRSPARLIAEHFGWCRGTAERHLKRMKTMGLLVTV